MGFLHGKRALITGILSNRSIAWGIANAMHREGAQLAFTYVDEKLKARVDEAAAAFGSCIVLPCDVSRDTDIETMFESLGKH
ncbi:MAG: SDR family oxidoreductase, partial [Rhodanobacteraceae bacterium]